MERQSLGRLIPLVYDELRRLAALYLRKCRSERDRGWERQSLGRLIPLVYDELRRLAALHLRGEPSGQRRPPDDPHQRFRFLLTVDFAHAAFRTDIS
jgi:hypothetical protein